MSPIIGMLVLALTIGLFIAWIIIEIKKKKLKKLRTITNQIEDNKNN